MALDQGFVLLAKIEFQPTPQPAKIIFAGTAFDEHRSHRAAAQRQGRFGAERGSVPAAEVAVSDEDLPIILEIVREIDLVEETGLDVVEPVNVVVVVAIPPFGPGMGAVVILVVVLAAVLPNSTPAIPWIEKRPR